MVDISLEHVEKEFGGAPVLHDCCLEIEDHEFMVLVGPSGSGKTTLLRLIAGLEEVTRGEIRFGDQVVNDVDVGDRDVAMVFQNYGLYPHMTAYNNMAFGLRRRGMSRGEVDRRVRHAASVLGLGDFLGRRPRQLSGGQRQRIALGRTIVREPTVFLLDEPLSNLDAHLRVQMRSEILRIHRAVTATAVYVTHDQVEALTMGDRVVVMNEGRIQQVGTPDELYNDPVNTFVGGFIGTPAMGFLTCNVVSGSGEVRLERGGVRLGLAAGTAGAASLGDRQRVTVGIRPEALDLVGESSDERSTIRGIVEVVEPLGAEQYVIVDVDGERITARMARSTSVKPNQKVVLSTQASAFHLFDPETGRALG